MSESISCDCFAPSVDAGHPAGVAEGAESYSDYYDSDYEFNTGETTVTVLCESTNDGPPAGVRLGVRSWRAGRYFS